MEKLLLLGHNLGQPAGERERGGGTNRVANRVGMGRNFYLFLQNNATTSVTICIPLQQERGDKGDQKKSLGT